MIFDFCVIGAGISGISAAAELARHGSVLVLEAESQVSYHATGRSAALFTPNYGNSTVCAINRASRPFLIAPPKEFCDAPILSKRGFLVLASPGQEAHAEHHLSLSTKDNPVFRLDAEEACELAKLVPREKIALGAYEPGVQDMDVDCLNQGFLRQLRRLGGRIETDLRVESLKREGNIWRIDTRRETFQAQIIINAAGAWADQVAILADVAPVGLVPKRRTAVLLDPPDECDVRNCPAVDFAGVSQYLKPQSGLIMASPGDETPMEPQDVQAEDLDVAILLDWLQKNTLLPATRPRHVWAGLRTFVEDAIPVVGFDQDVSGFFWLAGQGGYGIMMAPILAQTTAELITSDRLPHEMSNQGIEIDQLSPSRIR